MSDSFQQAAPGVIRLRQGGGCMAVFGLPFFSAGIFLLLAGLGILPIANAEEMSGFARPAFLLMGLAFTGVGGALVFGRSWVTLDTTQRVVLKQWGWLVPMHTQTHRLEGYSSVLLEFQEGDSDTADKFPIALKSRAGADLPLCSSTQYAEARAWAAAIARHLHLDIEDASSDHSVRLSPDQADLPLQHRLRLEHEKTAPVERPPSARSEVINESAGVQIVIPMPRVHPVALAFMVIPVLVPLVMFQPLSQFFRQTHTPGVVGWFFLGFLILMFGILPASGALHAFLSSRLGRTIVTVSMAGIKLQQRKLWRTKTLALHDASDIMDIDFSTADSLSVSAMRTSEQHVLRSGQVISGQQVVGERTQRVIAALTRLAKGKGITIKTRQGLTTFGQGLADDEIRYLHFVVRRALVGVAPSR
jgi:hypothetical protein